MRQAQPDDMAHVQERVGGHAQERVLVVDRGDLACEPARQGTERVGGQLRLGQPLVVGHVALAGVEQGQAGLGPGDDPRPDVHGAGERTGGTGPGERRDAPVEAVVVDDVGARPQEHPGARPGQRAEDIGDVVEEGAATCGDDHLVYLVDAGQRDVQGGEVVQVAADGVEPGR